MSPVRSALSERPELTALAPVGALAIDSYTLLGVFAAILSDLFPKREVREFRIEGPSARRWLGVLNVSLAGLVALLLVRGLTTGVTR